MVASASIRPPLRDFSGATRIGKGRRSRGGRRTNEPTMDAGPPAEKHFPEQEFDPGKLSLQVRVTLAASRESVDPVVAQVMQSVREMKCIDGKEDAIELALQEALANAVIHGAKEDPSKIVECIVACDEERGILIIVRDPGT